MIAPVKAPEQFGGKDSDIDEMDWTVPTYKRDRVNIAGRKLLEAMHSDFDRWTSSEWTAYFEHLEVINNWRASHAYPLLVMRMTLGNYARKVDSE
jgi:hypothetical protein